ncbi:MAG TPA: NAD(P)/FAD-dependent oxidoreductase [Vineibacter sp.]|nr:NAD(P)/FAD-dependent oxidoreductase [Vineibacter sp.]
MSSSDVDVLIVGAGFAGMYMLHRLRGLGFTARVLEAGTGVGGTWYWNRYPGARCDVESMQYSYQFDDTLQQEWTWSERYSPQPEILRYANHVADRYDLRRDIIFNARVKSATFDDATARWTLETDDGTRRMARFCVMATGCLSAPNKPKLKGLERFAGKVYHTGEWPHEGVDFTGQTVGVIGTGSSAIQSIPIIARQARQLFVFQRTANYMVPAHNAPLDPGEQKAVKADYATLRERARRNPGGIDIVFNERSALAVSPEERQREYEARWAVGGFTFMGSFIDLLFVKESNDTAANFVRGKIREIVKDPETASALSPTNIIGCKRLCVDIDYWQTFNRPNVTLVDVGRAPIEAITEAGVMANGREHAVDSLVLATGFDAMTGALLRVAITGRDGRTLQDKWSEGPKTYLGLAMAGFPNLFTITGPGSPSVLTNMLPSIEQHVEWIADCLAYMRQRGLTRIEPGTAAEEAWVAHARDVAGISLRATCDSWYVGANVPGKPRVLMPYTGGFPAYVQKCQQVVANGYEGFVLE